MEIQKGDFVTIKDGEFKYEVGTVFDVGREKVSIEVDGVETIIQKDDVELIG